MSPFFPTIPVIVPVMPKRDPKGRFAPKSDDQAERPIDQMRNDSASPAELTREELLSELERRDQAERYARDLPARPISDPEFADEPGITPAGCLQVIVIGVLLVVVAWLAWDKFAGGGDHPHPHPAPAPYGPVPPVPGPQVDLRSYTQPITAKLAYDPVKAERVEKIYEGFRAALSGPSGKRVTDTRQLELIQGAYLDDLNAKGGVMVGAEIDQAIGGYLGLTKSTDKDGSGWSPKTFTDDDRAKLVQIVAAVSQAGREAR